MPNVCESKNSGRRRLNVPLWTEREEIERKCCDYSRNRGTGLMRRSPGNKGEMNQECEAKDLGKGPAQVRAFEKINNPGIDVS